MPATWDSAYLLKMFNRKAARSTTDAITDPLKYERLSEAQNNIISQMMAICPKSLYPKVPYASLPTLTTTDSQVFTFGTDSNGYPIYPLGHAGIYPSLNAIPNWPWREGQDYISEGTQIRIPNNNTYSGTLWWYGAQQPTDIDATHQPSIFPEAARVLIVIDAVRTFAQEGVRNVELEDDMQAEWERQWPRFCLLWKTAYRQGGALSFSGLQLALAGQRGP